MATIETKAIIDAVIAKNGWSDDPKEPRVALIVEYETVSGKTVWGVTWINDGMTSRLKYMVPSEYVNNPRVIWRAS